MNYSVFTLNTYPFSLIINFIALRKDILVKRRDNLCF